MGQVFTAAGSAALPPALRGESPEKLLEDVEKLKFISGDLTGFTDCLLTLGQAPT